jgi:hypothetical protein
MVAPGWRFYRAKFDTLLLSRALVSAVTAIPVVFKSSYQPTFYCLIPQPLLHYIKSYHTYSSLQSPTKTSLHIVST